jgi:ATP-binding cassette subfamily C (CFTR/MRP) protein 1
MFPLLSPVIPRLALTAFKYSQPLLIQRLLDYLDEPANSDTKNIGYGLIGAYALVYLGLAVSSFQDFQNLQSFSQAIDINRILLA